MAELLEANFFRDRDIQDDPYPYFEALRNASPIYQEPHLGVFMVTGHEEAMEIYNGAAHFSSCNVVSGPFVPFPVPLEGDDVTDIIEEHRDMLPFSDQLPSFDPPKHTEHRALMMRLLTPRRLRENEEFMAELSVQLLSELVGRGRADIVADYAKPFALLVIAELEGVPAQDHEQFAEGFRTVSDELAHKPLEFLYEQFSAYVADRRADPKDDILTQMASAAFPDGTIPEVRDVALLAANLFTGGQETTVRMLSFAVRLMALDHELQARLRRDRESIGNFIEEVLRYESPLRSQFRMAKVDTTVAGVDIPAGSNVLLLPGAANRDPRMFENPDSFDVDRANAKYHAAFGHGIHHCAGAHLARAEGRVTVNRLLDLTADISIDADVHGPPQDRRWSYLPTFFLRGLTELGVRFDPA